MIRKARASEIAKGDVLYLGRGIIGRVTAATEMETRPAWYLIAFSDGFGCEAFKDDEFELLDRDEKNTEL